MGVLKSVEEEEELSTADTMHKVCNGKSTYNV
jgi:hypothetical protein